MENFLEESLEKLVKQHREEFVKETLEKFPFKFILDFLKQYTEVYLKKSLGKISEVTAGETY